MLQYYENEVNLFSRCAYSHSTSRNIYNFIFGFWQVQWPKKDRQYFDISSAKHATFIVITKRIAVIPVALTKWFIFKNKYLVVFDYYWESLYRMVSSVIYRSSCRTLETYKWTCNYIVNYQAWLFQKKYVLSKCFG